ncbi:MAG: maltose alpha-D-glucosyltransferase [Betaproteobacteria bacterium]|nr:maltose alpha-D-glucosyltransferase [Betaproteobacteria bacterium]
MNDQAVLDPTLVAAKTEDTLWYKDAIIYELHVKAFFDANDDGIGDFRGLTEKLDYIQDLGVTAIWLLPFYPSPMRDDGYDVADYHNVYPAYGTRNDVRQLVREAHRRGLHIITELVVNHTSDQHPWFQAARRAPKGSAKRDYYVWSEDPKKYAGTRVIFTDTETSNWAWDEVAQSHYWHRFFSHQPDLNFDNPNVLKAVFRTMRFWLDMGIDGFRMDAIPYLIEREGSINENLPETHAVIKKLRALMDEHYSDRMLLAEANQWPEDVREYFGAGDECHMAYHFPLMPRLFMAMAMEDRYPVVEIMQQTPEIPTTCQWAIFLRNHDELTLEMVTDRERDYMYQMYGAEQRMRVNVGIRRRLAPLLENSRDRIELMTFLLMTMPGSPILYYGDELGMGDNIYLGDRNGVRTPMQWSLDRNAGFSRADPQRLYLPVNMDPVYGYQSINVEAQARNPSSLLNWTRKLIGERKKHRAFGRGSISFLRPGNRKVLAYLREHDGDTILCVANLSRYAQAVELNLARFEGCVPVELGGKTSFPPVGKLPYLLTLPGHGYYAFQLSAEAPPPTWHAQVLPLKELPTLVLLESWRDLFSGRGGAKEVLRAISNTTPDKLRDEVLLPFLESRRWFAGKGNRMTGMALADIGAWRTPEGSWLFAVLKLEFAEIPPQVYFLPLAIAWEETGADLMPKYGAWALAKVRHKGRVGMLYMAFGNPDFCRALLRSMGSPGDLPLGAGRLRFIRTGVYEHYIDAEALAAEIQYPAEEQSNIGVYFGMRAYLKGYMRLQSGVNSEVEIGRFLTDESPYPNIASVLGAMEYVGRDGSSTALAIGQRFVRNQGSLWTYSLEYLDRHMGATAGGNAVPAEAQAPVAPVDPHALYTTQAHKLGMRVGELHRAFAAHTGNPAFDPEPVTAADLQAWIETVRADTINTFDRLERKRPELDEAVRSLADELLARRRYLLDRLQQASVGIEGLVKTRYHGDLHFGQVLITANDFVIIDFEGEPMRPVEERRAKASPLRDVAGMVRSASYAAHATAERLAAQHLDRHAEFRKDALEWQTAVTGAFLAGYKAATVGLLSVPQDAAAFKRLLDLFVIEKGLYEMRYELESRPQWAAIPIRGLSELIEGNLA